MKPSFSRFYYGYSNNLFSALLPLQNGLIKSRAARIYPISSWRNHHPLLQKNNALMLLSPLLRPRQQQHLRHLTTHETEDLYDTDVKFVSLTKSLLQYKKYYVVKRGRAPGIYVDHEQAKNQVLGFSDGFMKVFKDLLQAIKFYSSNNNTVDNSKQTVQKRTKTPTYYVVSKGKTPGIYLSLQEAEMENKGCSNYEIRVLDDLQLASSFLDHVIDINDLEKIKKSIQ